jgi:cytoskeletal protein CcmA (bactofilin family)
MTVLAPLALVASTGVLLALPLTPAVRELFSKRDAGPLVTRKDDGRIENFAHALRAKCQAYRPYVDRCTELEIDEAVELSGKEIFVCGRSGAWGGPNEIDTLALCARSVHLPDAFHSFNDFVAYDAVHSGNENLFRALLSEEDIVLGAGTQILRWIHAEGDLVAGENCALLGRASASKSIVLSHGCKFERIHAPAIYSSGEAASLEVRQESAAFAKLARAGMGRTRLHDKTHLAAGQQYFGDLVSPKSLLMNEDSSVIGSVKANGKIEMNTGAEVDGSLVATKDVEIHSRCFVKGPLIAERQIVIHPGVQIGLPGAPTTISAPRIHIAPGSVLFGTAWARVEGRVGD